MLPAVALPGAALAGPGPATGGATAAESVLRDASHASAGGTAITPEGRAYEAAIAALGARGRFGIRLGLGRTTALLHALGDPQRQIRGALVAGTNGKGSVQAMAAAMLRAAGYRVGQTPKPHLVEYRERIVVDGTPIGPGEMAALLERALHAAEDVTGRLGPPTEFEVLTAAAFTWFAEQGVDLAVVEVGLGGRLDATNAWDGGVAAITNVAMDHAELLGGTIPLIAREKAAIIKRGDLAVTGAEGVALQVVRRRARRMGVPLTETPPLQVLGMDRHGVRVVAPDLGEVQLGLLGRHQAANAAVALGVVDALERAGIARVPLAARRAGLEGTSWPGRLELIRVPPRALEGTMGVPLPGAPIAAAAGGAGGGARPEGTGGWPEGAGDWPRAADEWPGAAGEALEVDVLLDGAHNPAGIAALVEAFEELRPSLAPGRPTLLLAIMADKDVDGMMRRLARAEGLGDAHVVVTRVTERGAPPERLAASWSRPTSVEAAGAPGEAFERALGSARAEGGPLVVAGSLYLVGAVRGILASRGLVS